MFKGRVGYYLILVLFSAAAAWVGYFIAQVIRSNSLSSTSLTWLSVIAAAVAIGMGGVYFSMKRRHGERELPCNISDTENVKVNNYHFIMATSKINRGMALIESTDHVSGIAVELVKNDIQPHRIRIEVRLNERSDESTAKEMVINADSAVPIILPFPRRLSLADISSVDIRVRQV